MPGASEQIYSDSMKHNTCRYNNLEQRSPTSGSGSSAVANYNPQHGAVRAWWKL